MGKARNDERQKLADGFDPSGSLFVDTTNNNSFWKKAGRVPGWFWASIGILALAAVMTTWSLVHLHTTKIEWRKQLEEAWSKNK